MRFQAEVIFGLGKNHLFKSVLGHCGIQRNITCAVLMKNSCCGVYGLLGRWTRSFAEASRRSEKALEATFSPSMSHTFSLRVNLPST